MDFNIVTKVLNTLEEIKKYIKNDTFVIMQNDEQSILAGLHFNSFEIKEEEQLKIIQKFKKLDKAIEINHIVINSHICLFQGNLKGGKK